MNFFKDNRKQDVLRVVEFILDKHEKNESFSVCSAAKSAELNGIGEHRIADIMRETCMDPEGIGSLKKYTEVNANFSHNNHTNWSLNPDTYFGYMGYISTLEAIKTNKKTDYALKQSRNSLVIATLTLLVTLATTVISIVGDK